MRTFYKYISIVVTLCTICSCSLEELGLWDDNEKTVEFIARPAGYSNVPVMTKSDPTDAFETAIYTAYLLLFDENGKRVFFSEVDPASRIQRVTLRNLGTVTACFVANVTLNDVKDLNTLAAFNSAVLSNITYATYAEAGNHLGVPKLTINGESKLCFPMVGVKTVDVSQLLTIEIPLTRLFAKVSVELAMDLDISTSLAMAGTYFELMSYRLVNLPKRVSLVNQNEESAWVEISNAFEGENAQVASGIKHKIYTSDYESIGANQLKYTFDVYVPEYNLLPLASTTEHYGDEKYKPLMYDDDKHAVCLVLEGTYVPFTGASTNLQYNVYLGEDESTSFTLNRNVHYSNYLTITDIDDSVNGLDHRVTTSPGNMLNLFGEVANCYVISSSGQYNFPAYKGAYKLDDMTEENRCTEGTRVEIIAQNGASNLFTTDSNRNPIFTVTENPDGIKVIGFEVTDDWDDANVVIALKDSQGTTEWSWHLWFVKGPTLGDMNISGFFEMETQDMPSGDDMMDRNLGSLYSVTEDGVAGAANGFYYRYGHRAPYFEDTRASGNGTTFHGYSEDDYLSWDNSGEKSPTDPCPPGYRVPALTTWAGNAKKEHFSAKIMGYGVTAFNFNDDIYYPYREVSKSQNKVFSSPKDEEIYSAEEYKVKIFGVTIATIPDLSLRRYRNVTINVPIDIYKGEVLTNNELIKYEGGATTITDYSSIQIVSLEKSTRSITGVSRKSPYVTFSNWSNWNSGNVDSGDKITLLTKLFSELKYKYWDDEELTETTLQNGYQVRCVAESPEVTE